MLPEFETVEEAKSALRRAEEALERAMAREQEMLGTERQRLTELAHEIKTPLNAMIGFAHMMSEQLFGAMGDPRYAEYSRTVYEASLHLQDLCDDILGEGHDDGDPDIQVADVNVRDMADRIVQLFSQMAEERGVSLGAQIPADFPDIRTDPKRLNQIVMNLVSNAIKFTPRGGNVGIEADVDAATGAMIFVVADTGQGMSAARLKEAVKPYKQDQRGSPHGDKGIGLGLSIVDRLAQQLRGELRLISKKNVGTVASICLPLTYDRNGAMAKHGDSPPDTGGENSAANVFSLHQSTGS